MKLHKTAIGERKKIPREVSTPQCLQFQGPHVTSHGDHSRFCDVKTQQEQVSHGL
jgi:hypothetical protein